MTVASPRVGCVVVTFHPDENVCDRLTAMRGEADYLVVIDNGSDGEKQRELGDWCVANDALFHAEPDNHGLARALNLGVELLSDCDVEWVLFFDQDSRPKAGLSQAMLLAMGNAGNAEQIAALGPSIVDRDGVFHRWLDPHPWLLGAFRKRAWQDAVIHPVSMVITSGSLVRVSAWRDVGGFDEALFIDGVDTDFCLRLRHRKWQLVAVPTALLHHQLGARREVRLPGPLGRPTFHSPVRHYYMARNRWLLLRRHWKKGHWVTFEFTAGVLNTLRVVLAEDMKIAKLRAIVIGTCDGIRGRKGPCPRRVT